LNYACPQAYHNAAKPLITLRQAQLITLDEVKLITFLKKAFSPVEKAFFISKYSQKSKPLLNFSLAKK
jgi:hypothetical protein